MSLKLVGRKKGMTRIFDQNGDLIPCTVICIEPHVIAQIKNEEKDGYSALQLAAEKLSPSKARNSSKPLQGHFKKAGVDPRRFLKESRVSPSETYAEGQEFNVGHFEVSSYVNVVGVSKGKGYQGVMKRWNYAGGPAAHGSGFHRHAGSTGMRTSPGRCLPGVKKAGHMGDERVTVENLKVLKIDLEKNLIVVQGAVPGAQNSVVHVVKSTKKQTAAK